MMLICVKRAFLTFKAENYIITEALNLQFSLKVIPKGRIDNESALNQVMPCRLFGAKPLPEPMLTQFTDAHMRH